MSDIKERSPNQLLVFGIIGGLLGIYLTYILPAISMRMSGNAGMCKMLVSCSKP